MVVTRCLKSVNMNSGIDLQGSFIENLMVWDHLAAQPKSHLDASTDGADAHYA